MVKGVEKGSNENEKKVFWRNMTFLKLWEGYMFPWGRPVGFRKGNRSIFGASTGLLKWGWYLEPPPSTTALTMRIVLKPSRLATLPLHPPLGSSSPPPSQIPRPLAISPFTPLCHPTTHCVGWPSLLRNVQSTKAITTY